MTHESIESVGESFDEKLITSARDRTLAVIRGAAARIVPGMSEEQARLIVKELLQSSGAGKSWHAPQIRFGVNTLRAFGEPGVAEVILAENDVFFLDLGPVYDGHEGDVGRAFSLGHDPDMNRIVTDVEKIWIQVRDLWAQTQASGALLYSYARQQAKALGWELSTDEANGHRIADFPHSAKRRGTIEGLDFKPSPLKWILEIQIKHPRRPFGAFFEDLLV